MADRRFALINKAIGVSQFDDILAANLTVSGDWTLSGTTVINDLTVGGSTGPAQLTIEADTDNSVETDTASIVMTQDGGLRRSVIGMSAGNDLNPLNETVTGALSNALMIEHSNEGIQFALSGNLKASILPSLITLNEDVSLDNAEIGFSNGYGAGLYGIAANGLDFYTSSLTDDESAVINLSRSIGFILITSNFSYTASGIFGITSTELHSVYTGSKVSVGSGSNPNVDGNLNIWLSSNGVLNIKNRLGSTRSAQVYLLKG